MSLPSSGVISAVLEPFVIAVAILSAITLVVAAGCSVISDRLIDCLIDWIVLLVVV